MPGCGQLDYGKGFHTLEESGRGRGGRLQPGRRKRGGPSILETSLPACGSWTCLGARAVPSAWSVARTVGCGAGAARSEARALSAGTRREGA
jgi:hypothetical protein